MKTTLLACFAAGFLILQSCAGIRGMRVQVQRPAEITISKNIRTVAILNRSIEPSKPTAESVLTMERPMQDKELSEECIRGLNELLQTSERFTVKRCEGTMMALTGLNSKFTEMMLWAQVDSICKAYDCEALLVLEHFDTDFQVNNPVSTAVAVADNVLNGGNVTVTGRATSTAEFRVYYPAQQTIVYQDHFGWNQSWTQSSTNPAEAVAKLIKKNQALMNVSYANGEQFAASIVPLYFWEDREMYKGKKGEMQRGERQALAKDWEAAVTTWKEAYESSSKQKTRAKAAFNVALGLEVLGNLEEARSWVQKSYVEDGKSTALRYSDILDQRIREQSKLEQQVQE